MQIDPKFKEGLFSTTANNIDSWASQAPSRMYNLDMPRSSRFNVQIDLAATYRGLPRQKQTNKKHEQMYYRIFFDESKESTLYVLSSHLFWTSDVRTRTSRGHTGGRSQMISPPSLCGACLNFYREKDSATPFPLVDREVEFCVPTN